MDSGGLLRSSGTGARGHDDADRLLDTLEDAGVDLWLVAFGGAVDDPDVVAGAAEVVAHLLESEAAEEASGGDVADDTGVVLWVLVEYLPGRPAPEVDVEVVEVFAMNADAPLGRGHPCFERGGVFGVSGAVLDPAAETFGLYLVRRIAKYNSD